MAFPGMSPTRKPETKPAASLPLASERCDSCGAPSLARAESPSGGAALVFCRHHAEGYRARLEEQGFTLSTFYDALDNFNKA